MSTFSKKFVSTFLISMLVSEFIFVMIPKESNKIEQNDNCCIAMEPTEDEFQDIIDVYIEDENIYISQNPNNDDVEAEIEIEEKHENTELSADIEKPKCNDISLSDRELLAKITMAEAGDQSEEGIRLVIDVILNRVDSPKWPNDIRGVVYQKGQFSPIWNGRFEKCYARNDILALVDEELENRLNYEVTYFRMYRYHNFGTPLFKCGDHYFSK